MRDATHGRDIAEVPRKRALADDGRRLITAEMDVLNHGIDFKQEIFAGAGAVDGAIVANAHDKSGGGPGQAAELRNDLELIHARYS
jgi:hypothetical protein